MADTVATGVYFGFTLTEIAIEIEKYKQARKTASDHMAASGGGRIGSGNIGGQNVSYVYPEGVGSLEEWAIELQNAQAQLNDEDMPFTTTAILGAGSIS